MARAINPGQVTPADELRTLLEVSEKRVVNLPGSGAAAVDLLLDLDRIASLWPELEAQGVDLRAEAGRWETLQATLQRYAPELVRQMRTAGGFPAVRARYGRAEAAAWWWTLDVQLRAANRRRRLRAAGVMAIVLAVAAGLYFLVRVLFPVDPTLQAAMDATLAGERKIADQGDFAGAVEDFRRVTELTPTQAEAWLRLGVALHKVGDAVGAEAAFQRARPLLGSEVELRVMRASVYIAFNMLDEAEADLQMAQRLEPNEPMIYFYQANIFESRQLYRQALEALERADALAEQQGQTQLMAVIRYRRGMLMQQPGALMAIPTVPAP